MQRYLLSAFMLAIGWVGLAEAADMRTLTALYRSELTDTDSAPSSHLKAVDWKFVRGTDYVSVSDVGRRLAEHWQKDPVGRVWYRRVFHTEHKVIEYQPIDLSLSGMSDSWSRITSVIDPEMFAALARIPGTQSVLGRQAVIYRGTHAGVAVEMWWLPEAGLPAFIEKRGKRARSILKLVSLQSLEPATGHGTTSADGSDGYELIDFSDLGDRHHDPFIEALMRHEGSWFGHGH